MARHRGLHAASAADLLRDSMCFVELDGYADAMRQGGVAVLLDDRMCIEPARDRRRAMDLLENEGNPLDPIWSANLIGRHAPPLDESGYEPALRLQKIDHLRPDANLGGPKAGCMLGGAVDAQQLGVFAPDT